MKKRKNRVDLLNILKYCMVLALLVYIVLLVSMQGGTSTSISTMGKNIQKVIDMDGMKNSTTQDLKKFYGLNADDYKGVLLSIPDDVMGVDEMLLVRLNDVSQAGIVEKAAQERIETQKESFEGYGAEQMKLINAAVLESRGDYVLLVISKDADAVQRAFRKSL